MRIAAVFTIALLSLFTCDAVSAQDQPSQGRRDTLQQRRGRIFQLSARERKDRLPCSRKFGIDLSGIHVVRLIAMIATAVSLMNGVAEQALAATSSPTFRFSLPGGSAILYSNASNPQAPLPERSWQRAVFHLPNGATFCLLPKVGKSDATGAEIEPPNESDISPFGQYAVIRRVESGGFVGARADGVCAQSAVLLRHRDTHRMHYCGSNG